MEEVPAVAATSDPGFAGGQRAESEPVAATGSERALSSTDAAPPPKMICADDVPNICAVDRITVEDKSTAKTGPDCKVMDSAAVGESPDAGDMAAAGEPPASPVAPRGAGAGAAAANSDSPLPADDGPLSYRLPNGAPLVLQRGDITKWFVDRKTDAIVNAANEIMLGGGGVDGAIHRAAGPRLYYACKQVPVTPHGRCPTGEARITGGFDLPAAYVIHTVGPVFSSSQVSEPLLRSAYRSSVQLAEKSGIKYLCFPAISCGVYGYPYDEGAKVALQAIKDSAEKLSEVHFVLFERKVWTAWKKAADALLEPISASSH